MCVNDRTEELATRYRGEDGVSADDNGTQICLLRNKNNLLGKFDMHYMRQNPVCWNAGQSFLWVGMQCPRVAGRMVPRNQPVYRSH